MGTQPMTFARSKPFASRRNGVSRIRRDTYGKPTDWYALVKQVTLRDKGLCQNRILGRICGRKGRHVHHIVPLSRGGLTRLSNLILFCVECHESRHSHM